MQTAKENNSMSEECNNDCSKCGSDCSERKNQQTDFRENPHELSNIKKVIAVVSGKGGVGKSLVTSMLASKMRQKGFSSSVLDADITGPSIPRIFGLKVKAQNSSVGLFPVKSETGIGVMSINLLLENETDMVAWRGPLIAGAAKQFWTDVIWGDVDYLFIDMPPGTGDVPLTVFQSIPVDGIIIVTSPQELVSMIVSKAVKMAKTMNIPILGLVENMSYIICPDCKKEIKVFGESKLEEQASKHQIEIIDRIPFDSEIAAACDKGKIEYFDNNYLQSIAKHLENMNTIEQ